MNSDVGAGGILPGEGNEEGGEIFEITFQLSGADRRFLETAARFLVGVNTPMRAKAARRSGYTQQEHAIGWSLYAKAAGQERPLAYQIDEGDDAVGTSVQAGRLRELDTFENLWFPRTKAIIRRVVPVEERDRFAAAFFADLEQQPLGPMVVGSVTTFLSRVEGLSKSTLKGASDVRETLRKRGLTDAEIGRIHDLLAKTRDPWLNAPAPDSGGRLEASRDQQKALADLRDWFNDWATTLRPVLPMRDRIALGLTPRKRGDVGDGDGAEGDGAEGDGAEGDGGVDESDDEGAELAANLRGAAPWVAPRRANSRRTFAAGYAGGPSRFEFSATLGTGQSLQTMARQSAAKTLTWDGRELPAEVRELPPGRYTIEPVEDWGLSDDEEAEFEDAIEAADRGESLEGVAVLDELRKRVSQSRTGATASRLGQRAFGVLS
jgi:hypothetical protein